MVSSAGRATDADPSVAGSNPAPHAGKPVRCRESGGTRPDGEERMRDRRSNERWQTNGSRAWSSISVNEAREDAGGRSAAAHRDALKRLDAHGEVLSAPAGVSERRVGFQFADQTPAGGARRSPAGEAGRAGRAMLTLRSASGVRSACRSLQRALWSGKRDPGPS